MKALVLAFALVGSVTTANAYPLWGAPGYAPNCSNAGDETSRPVFKRLKSGRVVVVGYKCVQSNNDAGGGGARF